MKKYRVFIVKKLLDYGVTVRESIDFASWQCANEFVAFCHKHEKTPYKSQFSLSPVIYENAFLEAI